MNHDYEFIAGNIRRSRDHWTAICKAILAEKGAFPGGPHSVWVALEGMRNELSAAEDHLHWMKKCEEQKRAAEEKVRQVRAIEKLVEEGEI